jgi:hypothetical protein
MQQLLCCDTQTIASTCADKKKIEQVSRRTFTSAKCQNTQSGRRFSVPAKVFHILFH